MVGEHPGQGLGQGVTLGPHPAAGQIGQHPRVAFPGDHRADHVLHRGGGQLRRDRRHLDQRVFQQFFQPRPAPGLVLGQPGPRPGIAAQRPDLGRRHERGTQQAQLGQPGQPHRIQPVGLGPARQVPGLAGVDQLHIQPPGLQDVKPDPPVIGGGLQRHLLHALGHQPGGQLGDRVHRGQHRLHHRPPPLRLGGVRQPQAHHALLLSHVHRGHPLENPFMLLIVEYLRLAHRGLLSLSRWDNQRAARGPGQATAEYRPTCSRQQEATHRVRAQRPGILAGSASHCATASTGSPHPSWPPKPPPRSQTPPRRGSNPSPPPARATPGFSPVATAPAGEEGILSVPVGSCPGLSGYVQREMIICSRWAVKDTVHRGLRPDRNTSSGGRGDHERGSATPSQLRIS
jgi:hypothetical protein